MDAPIDLNLKKIFLRNQSFFSKLTEKELDVLAGLLTEVHFRPGETIVQEGDAVDSIFIIVKGTANVKQISLRSGKISETFITKLQVQQSIGLNETGLYSLTGKRTATVIADSELVALRLSVAALHGFALAYSHVQTIMKDNAKKLFDNQQQSNVGKAN